MYLFQHSVTPGHCYTRCKSERADSALLLVWLDQSDWDRFFLCQAELWSWPHPSLAIPSRDLSTHRSRTDLAPITSERRLLGSIPENADGHCCLNRSLWHRALSIGTPSVNGRKWHPSLCDHLLGDDDTPTGSVCRAAIRAALYPTVHPASAN